MRYRPQAREAEFLPIAILPFWLAPSKGRSLNLCGFVAHAGVAELVDALVLGTSIVRCGGSSPFARTSLALGLIKSRLRGGAFWKA